MQRKHAFPGMFFIINERLRGPLYGSMFCAAPIRSRPRPSFPPSLSPRPANQRSWLSPAGRQSVISNESEASFSVCPSLFSCPLASSSFSIPPSLWPLCSPAIGTVLCFVSNRWSLSIQRGGNVFKHGCYEAIRLRSLELTEDSPVSFINKRDLVLIGLRFAL